MIVEIRGAGFLNKGAELMLLAILERLRAKVPHASLTAVPTDPDGAARTVEAALEEIDDPVTRAAYLGNRLWYQLLRGEDTSVTWAEIEAIRDSHPEAEDFMGVPHLRGVELLFAGEAGAADTDGFTRQNWWGPVGDECRMLRESAGIIDISNFAKYRVVGKGSEDWLNGLFANRMPREVGRSCLTPLIGKRGGIAGDFPICVVPMLHQDLQRTNVPLWAYFCQISDSTTSYGSYSGAVPNEKITWGKLDVNTQKFIIESDATIVAPLIFAYLLDE